MWFGDERGYNATHKTEVGRWWGLWFGDERGYNATVPTEAYETRPLWFGDERGYNATRFRAYARALRCGLVMKEDITQQGDVIDYRVIVVVW